MPETIPWRTLSARLGRNELPVTLAMAVFVENTLTDKSEIAEAISESWTAAEWPAKALTTTIWSMLYGKVLGEDEYLHDGIVKSREELPESITLYRGCADVAKVGMSWTSERKTAEWFMKRFQTRFPASIYTITVSRDLVLAIENGRNEHEYVLDPELLGDEDVILETKGAM